MLTLDEAATLGCKACGTPGGGCQFLGTAATSQVVGEALGLAPLHTALAPSGSAVWREIATRAAELIMGLKEQKFGVNQILTDAAIHSAMIVHAAFGGSTNLLLHIPAIAHAAGLRRSMSLLCAMASGGREAWAGGQQTGDCLGSNSAPQTIL